MKKRPASRKGAERAKHLLGFVREGREVRALFSTSPYFYDLTRESRCIALVVPLGIGAEDVAWTRAADFRHLPAPLARVIDSDRVLLTSAQGELCDLFVLMYPRANNPHTSRGGIVLERNEEGFSPLVAWIDGRAFLVELKGCGCPVGKFGDFHLRRTSPTGFHVHLAGALRSEGAQREYEGLEARREAARRLGVPLELRAVAWGEFTHSPRPERFGQVIRFCPSSLRASFCMNPALDSVLHNDHATTSRCLGEEAGQLLECADPRIHRNPSLNNLCFVGSGNYVLTDIEAAPSVAEGYEALDFPDSVVPDHYRHRARSERYFPEVLDGLRSGLGPIARLISEARPKNEGELTKIVFDRLLGLRVFRRRFHSPTGLGFLRKNVEHLQVFMPEEYFRMDLCEWVGGCLIALLRQKVRLCELYASVAAGAGIESLRELLSSITSLNRSRRSEAKEIRDLLKVQAGGSSARLHRACILGAYVPHRVLETLWVEAPESFRQLHQNEAILRESLVIAQRYAADRIVVTDFDRARSEAIYGSSWTAADIVFPYLGFIGTYLANERRILDGAAHHRHSLSGAESAALARSRQVHVQLAHWCEREPQVFHSWLRLGTREVIDRLRLPYMAKLPEGGASR